MGTVTTGNAMSSYQYDENKRSLNNALVAMASAVNLLLHGRSNWDDKMKLVHSIARLTPLVLRYLIYFRNIENPALGGDSK